MGFPLGWGSRWVGISLRSHAVKGEREGEEDDDEELEEEQDIVHHLLDHDDEHSKLLVDPHHEGQDLEHNEDGVERDDYLPGYGDRGLGWWAGRGLGLGLGAGLELGLGSG